MTKSKAFSFLESSAVDNSSTLIRWLITLAAIGLVGSLAIGLLLKRQAASAQSTSVETLLVSSSTEAQATH